MLTSDYEDEILLHCQIFFLSKEIAGSLALAVIMLY